MAILAIKQNKLRSILTLLGISVGVFSVVGVMTAIKTLESSVESGLNVFATNTFVIQKYPEIQINGGRRKKYRNRKNITFQHYEKLKKRSVLPVLISAADGTSVRNISYKDKKIKKSTELYGGDKGTLRIYNTYLSDGRNFIEEDLHRSKKVCILGMDVVDKLFPFEDPILKKIKIDGLNYNVIGIAERKGEAFGGSQDNYIAVPISTFLERFSSKNTSIRIHVESENESTYQKTMDEVIGLLRSIRKVVPDQENDFEIVTNAKMIEQFSGFTGGIKIFAFSVSLIALIVAGIGIMNIMLVTVTERTKEIGVCMSVGAKKRDVLLQFLIESLMISLIGGCLGIALGLGVIFGVSEYFNWKMSLDYMSLVLSFVFSSSIGVIFGFYPARKAASLNPIDALRYE